MDSNNKQQSKSKKKTSQNTGEDLREKVISIFTQRQLKDIKEHLFRNKPTSNLIKEYEKRNGSKINLSLLKEYKKNILEQTLQNKKVPKWIKDTINNDKDKVFSHININLSSPKVKSFMDENKLNIKEYIDLVRDEIREIRKYNSREAKRIEKAEAKEVFDFIGNVSVEMDVLFVSAKGIPYWDKIRKDLSISVKTTERNLDNEITNVIEGYKQELIDSYSTNQKQINEIGETSLINRSIQKKGSNGKNLNLIPMRERDVCIIDGYEDQTWDTNTGRCVFDYIISKYGNIKGFKRICNYKDLNDIFTDYEDINLLELGVNTLQILRFCEEMGIAMYAVDDNEDIFNSYQPKYSKTNASSMIFRLSNNHFYPIEKSSKRKNISRRHQIQNTSGVKSEIFSETKTADDTEFNVSPIRCENLMHKLKEQLSVGYIPSITMYDNNLQSITCKDKIYIENTDKLEMRDRLQRYMQYDKNGYIRYYPDTNVSISRMLFQLIEETVGSLEKSTPNLSILEDLIMAKSNKTHTGFINDYVNIPDKYDAFDIIKSYSYSIYSNVNEFMIIEFNDNWEDYNEGDAIEKGLYKVLTKDILLFRGNNIYTWKTIEKALDEGIEFTITKKLIAKKYIPNVFRDIIDRLMEYCKVRNENTSSYDTDVVKYVINYLTGILGKSNTDHSRYHINSDKEQILISIDEQEQKNPNFKFTFRPIEGTEYFIYGYSSKQQLNETNIPMYLQIIEDNNIRLYELMKKVGIQNVIARKVDCIITTPVSEKTFKELILNDGDKTWGNYRETVAPAILSPELPTMKFDENDDVDFWNDRNNINNSDDWFEIFKKYDKYNGLLLIGDAGKGKTFVAKQISKYLEQQGEMVIKVAPTNKASINIQGTTIHKFLKINETGKISPKLIKKCQKYTYIIVDEVSMLGKYLLKRLCLLKQACPHLKFLLLGDDKQLPPVEDEEYNDYFNHPAIKYLANNNRNRLTVLKRYDETLYNLLCDVDNIDTSKFSAVENRKNVSFLNETRRHINSVWNNKEKYEGCLFIPSDPENDSKDMYIYPNLPVIGRRNLTVNKELLFANSEEFTVIDYDDTNIYLSNERPDDDGNPYMYAIDIPIKNFNEYFELAYCITTHKAQGCTFTEPFTIYDWDIMNTKLRYTSLSRAKNINQVSFNKVSFNQKQDKFKNAIQSKIDCHHKKYDETHGYSTNIDVDYIVDLYDKQNGECFFCGCNMKKFDWVKSCKHQFSINRINNRKGHIKGNVNLTCWGCNRSNKNFSLTDGIDRVQDLPPIKIPSRKIVK